MTNQIYNEEYLRRTNNKIVAISKNILSGDLGIIAGARQLAVLRFDVKAERDPDFLFFVGLDSETDHLPIGDVRRSWNPDALRAKDTDLVAYESGVREKAFEACRNLIGKYEKLAD